MSRERLYKSATADGRWSVLSARGFGFDFVGGTGSAVIVEGSANMQNRLPLQTNLLGTGSLHFTDSASRNKMD